MSDLSWTNVVTHGPLDKDPCDCANESSITSDSDGKSV